MRYGIIVLIQQIGIKVLLRSEFNFQFHPAIALIKAQFVCPKYLSYIVYISYSFFLEAILLYNLEAL